MIFRRKYSVLMVCTANICRSPMAESMLRHLLRREGLTGRVKVDSAGTQAAKGYRPDIRAQQAVRRWGAKPPTRGSRQVTPGDFTASDLILCMEQAHRDRLLEQCPEAQRGKIALIMDFAPEGGETEVPDPYFGNTAGFERVVGLLEPAIEGVIERIRSDLERA